MGPEHLSRIQVLVNLIDQTCHEIRDIKRRSVNNSQGTSFKTSFSGKKAANNSYHWRRGTSTTRGSDINRRSHNSVGTRQKPPGKPSPIPPRPSPPPSPPSISTRTPLSSSSPSSAVSRDGISDEELEPGELLGVSSYSVLDQE